MQSLERSIGILKALAAAHTEELRLSDVARAVRLSKATTSRILSALCDAGLVEASHETRTFRLGPELAFLGWSAVHRLPRTRIGRPVGARLSATAGGHVVKEVSGVGVAIKDPRGHPIAAVSVATISSRFQDARQAALIRVTQAAAREIERALRDANGG